MSVENSHFMEESKPNAIGAMKLHHLFRQRVKKSFIKLIEESSKVLKSDYDDQIAYLEVLDDQKRFSVNLYDCYFSLLESMSVQDKNKCNILINTFKQRLENDSVYTDSLLIRTQKNEPWEDDFQEIMLNDRNMEIVHFDKLSSEELAQCRKYVNSAINIIQQSCDDFYQEIIDRMSMIYFVKGDFLTLSGSCMRYFSSIGMKPHIPEADPILYYFDLIIHESSHNHLFTVFGADPVVLNDKEPCYSAARNCDRPMKGTFHAHFVFYRLFYMYYKALSLFVKDQDKIDWDDHEIGSNARIIELPWDYEKRIVCYRNKFLQSEEVLKSRIKLTPIGQKLFNNMSEHFREITNGHFN